MRIIVGGAGSVGQSIIGYLSKSDNDIIVIDPDQERLSEVARLYDVQPVKGSVSNPDVQEKAGADKADILIAMTDNDEVNLVACQVAHSLFNVGKKIARIDSEYFLSPLWNTLYNEKNLPIDLVISPNTEIAQAILRLIALPGAREFLPLMDGAVSLVCFKCTDCCPFLGKTLAEIYAQFTDFKFFAVQIVRGGLNFLPKAEDVLKCNDEIYLMAKRKDIFELLYAFAANRKVNRNIVIFGANAISYEIARQLEENDAVTSCKIVTGNAQYAETLAQNLNKTAVICGEMMSDAILESAGIENADLTIAVTEQDKDNLLVSLLARHNHICTTISLVNSRAYDNLVDHIGDNVIVDRSTVTVSRMLQDIRKAPLINAYLLGRGFGEIWELKISEENMGAEQTIADLNMPENCAVCLVLRENEILFPTPDEIIHAGDKLAVFVTSAGIRKIEGILGY